MKKPGAAAVVSLLWQAWPAMAGCDLPRLGPGETLRFLTPVVGEFRVGDGYGMKMHPLLHLMRLHAGLDFAAQEATVVIAAATGEVIFANRNGEFGNDIKIGHDAGMETEYAHLSKFAPGISIGKCVGKGDAIGYVGHTGLSTGSHLHFEVHRDGVAIDPQLLVGAQK